MFDAIDRTILTVLRDEGRTSHARLALLTGLSATAIGERVRKLEHAGVIRGYRAVLDPARVGLAICAFVWIAQQPRTQGQELVDRLLGLPEVEELHAVAGTYGYLAKVRVPTPPELDAFLDRLFMLEGVERTETTVVLRTTAERPMTLPFAAGEGA